MSQERTEPVIFRVQAHIADTIKIRVHVVLVNWRGVYAKGCSFAVQMPATVARRDYPIGALYQFVPDTEEGGMPSET